MASGGELFRAVDTAELARAVEQGGVTFHRGTIGGAWPVVKP
jgi:hypothetical protein